MNEILTSLSDPAVWVALASITAMEIVLGIDNLIFISVLTNKLPQEQRARARKTGIAGALILRLALLATIALIIRLTDPLFEFFGLAFSWRDLILIAGGAFLVWKATTEIHHIVDPDTGPDSLNPKIPASSAAAVIGQILVLDLVFSIDSIITAVGMTENVAVMVAAVVIAVAVMLFAAEPLANFISRNPTIVMLALGFLLLIGTTLIAEGFGAGIPKGYIYAAMAFSSFIEGLNMLGRRKRRLRDQVE